MSVFGVGLSVGVCLWLCGLLCMSVWFLACMKDWCMAVCPYVCSCMHWCRMCVCRYVFVCLCVCLSVCICMYVCMYGVSRLIHDNPSQFIFSPPSQYEYLSPSVNQHAYDDQSRIYFAWGGGSAYQTNHLLNRFPLPRPNQCSATITKSDFELYLIRPSACPENPVFRFI